MEIMRRTKTKLDRLYRSVKIKKDIKVCKQIPKTDLYQFEDKTLTREELSQVIATNPNTKFIVVTYKKKVIA